MKTELFINDIEPDMILGEDIYDNNGHLLLKSKTKLTQEEIIRIKKSSRKRTIKIFSQDLNVNLNNNKTVPKEQESQIIVKEKLKNMEKSIKENFDKISRHNSPEKIKKEIDKIANDIQESLVINTFLLNEILEVKEIDEYLYNHSLNVAVIANMIGKWLNFNEKKVKKLILAGVLHDIGKLKIEKKILNKKEKLNSDEFEIMKSHSTLSYKMLMNIGYKNKEILKAVIMHHEKEDGSGYPLGVKGNEIPIFAKILSIADIFDAMTSDRCYKKRVSPFKVLEMFQNQTFGKLDYKIVIVFIEKFLEHYIGSEVLLTNGIKAKITSINIYELTKPFLMTENGNFIDLSKERNIFIIDFLDTIDQF